MVGLWRILVLGTVGLMVVMTQWTTSVRAEDTSSDDELENGPPAIGTEGNSVEDLKRASSFLRIGKASAFLRIGRGPSSFLRIGRNPQSQFVRIGKAPSSMFLRIGKRMEDSENGDLNDLIAENDIPGRVLRSNPSSFLRIGKSLSDDDAIKRASTFLRIGRQSPSTFLRIGKSVDDEEIPVDKRTNAFLRIGKIPASSFMRIGRGSFPDDSGINTRAYYRNRAGASGFVRIGKREAIPAEIDPTDNHESYFTDLHDQNQ